VSKSFRVVWEIDVRADNLQEAAKKAHQIQLDQGSADIVFDVWRLRNRTTVVINNQGGE
jgi:hypothetical protein